MLRHNKRFVNRPYKPIKNDVEAHHDAPAKEKGEMIMDFNNVPIGFGLALSANTVAMNRYSHLSESQKQEILNKAHNVRSETEMYSLVASLANGQLQ